MSKTKRVLRVAVALLVAVCMVVGCTAGAYAEVITLVAFSAVVVVSAVLTACGLIMSSGNNPEAWENLCKTVAEVAQLPATLSLRMWQGLTYLDAAIINAIVQAAQQQEAFSPTRQAEHTATFSDGTVLPFFETKEGHILTPMGDYLGGAIAGDYLGIVTTLDSSAYTQSYFDGKLKFSYMPPMSNSDLFFNYSYASDVLSPGRGFLDVPHYLSGLCCTEVSGVLYLYCFVWSTNLLEFPSAGWIRVRCDRFLDALPSISAEFPWDLDADHAGIDEDGKVALPGAWAGSDAGVVIDGAPALPLTVPDNTIAGAATQDPTAARTGEGTKVDADNPPITDAKVKEAVEQHKLSLTIIDYFPFCIPFDLVRGVQLLQAPVEEPVFDIPLKVPYLGEQTLHIDLTEWDGVFVITRWFLLLGFVAGLALVTSKVIKW